MSTLLKSLLLKICTTDTEIYWSTGVFVPADTRTVTAFLGRNISVEQTGLQNFLRENFFPTSLNCLEILQI